MLQNFDDLPETARKLFEEAQMSGNRRQQTKIVNGVMKESKTGKGYEIDFEAPIFEDLRTKYERRWGNEIDRGVILEIAETQCGSAEKLKKP